MPTPTNKLGTLIVTGASRGIGAAIARLAGQRGYAVAVNFCTAEPETRKVVAEVIAAGGPQERGAALVPRSGLRSFLLRGEYPTPVQGGPT